MIATTLSNFFEPLQIKWEVYFVKEVFTRRLLLLRYVYNNTSDAKITSHDNCAANQPECVL